MKFIKIVSNRLRISGVAVVVLAIAGAVMTSVWPVMLSGIYDQLADGTISTLPQAMAPVLIFGVVYAVAELSGTARRIWTDNIAATFEKEMRNKSIVKLLRLPTAFYSHSISGEYTARINQAVAGASQLIKVVLNNVVPSVFIAFFTVVQIVCKAPLFIAAILVTYIALEITISVFQIKSQRGIRELLVGRKANLDGAVCQSIQNIEMIRVTHAEEYEFGRISPLTQAICSLESRHHTTMGSYDCAKQLVKVSYTIILLLVSAWLVSTNKITSGMVITIILLFQQLVGPINAVHAFMDELSSCIVKAEELIKLLEHSEDHIFSQQLKDIVFPEGDITVDNLTVYTPDGSTAISKDINLTLSKGAVIGLKGPTGCGKSSLMKGIMRFLPAEGSVSAGGHKLTDASQKSLCQGIHSLVQYPVFFAGSLRDNLVYGLDYTPEDSQLVHALAQAAILDELSAKTEDVLSIPIAENGTNFSGGQRQRIAMARAYLRQPKWFFIDEATASIDDDTTDKVFDNFIRYARSIGAGVLCISHQSTVMAKCDRVISLA